jgi:hypothetical protein
MYASALSLEDSRYSVRRHLKYENLRGKQMSGERQGLTEYVVFGE